VLPAEYLQIRLPHRDHIYEAAAWSPHMQALADHKGSGKNLQPYEHAGTQANIAPPAA
jgi:hypothetical protein